MYQVPPVHPPSLEDIERLAADLDLGMHIEQMPHLFGLVTMYQAPSVYPPSLEDIERLAADLDLGIHKEQMPEYRAHIAAGLKDFDVLEKYIEPTLPVKYPRTPGYRPSREENKYNAWYYKTDIPGAAEGPLKGYKVVVKDSFPVAGVPMMHGSRVVEGYVPDYDPTVVTRLLDAGANVVGKAVCEDFCFSGSSFTSHPYPVLNPHDTTHATGGSSSGCGALVQTGEADIGVAGDQGGSIRMPSSWCGNVGLKATFGLIPFTGLLALAPFTDNVGPITRTVKDCALALEAMAGDDGELDFRQRNIPKQKDLPKYSQLLTGNVDGKRVGILKEGFDGCDEDVAGLVMAAAKRLEERRAKVEQVSVPMHADGASIWGVACGQACYHTMVTSQGHTFGPTSYYATSAIDNYFAFGKARSRDFSTTVKCVQLQSKYVFDNYGLHFYAKSQNLLRLLRQQYDKALETYDVLIMPTMKTKATKLPEAGYLSVSEYSNTALSMIGNTAPIAGTGHPAITINAGFSEGLPIGMQIVGRHLAEPEVLNIAYAYEQILADPQKK